MTDTLWSEPVEPSDEEKEKVLGELAAKMKKLRDAQPDEAAIQKAKDATRRLLGIAEGDTGQSRRVADFLLAWWNAGECGGFDFADLWNVDMEIADDMVTVFALLPNFRDYPD